MGNGNMKGIVFYVFIIIHKIVFSQVGNFNGAKLKGHTHRTKPISWPDKLTMPEVIKQEVSAGIFHQRVNFN